MKVRRKDKRILFKDVPCGKTFETENGVYMKCFYDKDSHERELFGVRLDSGMIVEFPLTRDVTLLDMEAVEV